MAGNRIDGKVLVRELNVGVPDLVVAIYDVDPVDRENVISFGDHAGIFDRLTQFVLRRPLSTDPDWVQWWDSLKWDRLGSVLTRQDGSFVLQYDDDLFQRRDPKSPRPDYVLFVLAPEDPITSSSFGGVFASHPLFRLLHFSWVMQSGSGRQESYVVRLARADLESRNIPFGAGTTDRSSVVAQASQRLAAAAAAKTSFRTTVATAQSLAAGVASNAANVMQRAMHRNLDLTGRKFVIDAAQRGTLQREVAEEGLQRLVNRRLRVKMPPGATGTVDRATVNETLREQRDRTDLTRTRSLLEACEARHQLRRLLATNTEHSDDGDDNDDADADDTTNGELTDTEIESILRSRIVGQVADLPSAKSQLRLEKLRSVERADASRLQQRLDALELRGGPADAVAFHDFHSLQIAFRSIWRRVFDQGVRRRGEELYERWVAVREYTGLGEPDAAAREELAELDTLVRRVQGDYSTAAGIAQRSGTLPDWDGSPTDSFFGVPFFPPLPIPGMRGGGMAMPPTPRDMRETFGGGGPHAQASSVAGAIFGGGLSGLFGGSRSSGPGVATGSAAPLPPSSHLLGRVEGLTLDLAQRLSEPYQFDVFEPGSYNFGVLTTYRQRWEPLTYQPGELVASVPLAPGEKRQLKTRQVIKQRREEGRQEATSSSSRTEQSHTSRADAEIVNRASTTTNFNQSIQGEFSFGDFLKLTTTSQFSLDQQRHSEARKKDFRESVVKAADEYRSERKLEIKQIDETESTDEETREISNPNNEITVTYLFYELQRRYKVSEQLHRARPVILVAQDVPSPDQIDEGFLVAHEWILRRALLDETLLPALGVLTTEMPGDEFSVAVFRATWERNLAVVEKISSQLDVRSKLRDDVRTRVLELMQKVAQDGTTTDVATAIFSGGLSLLMGGGGDDEGQRLQAARDAADRELEFTESELAETERRLKQATSALEESTSTYVAAVRAQLNRRTAVDQLRVHVKQNILYYMQAIWNHEPPDQRFFRLYDRKIDWFEVDATDTINEPVRTEPPPSGGSTRSLVNLVFGTAAANRSFVELVASAIRFVPEGKRLGEVADIDSLLGFKGNYMIFPLKEACALTEFMMQDYDADPILGLLDPDDFSNYTNEELAGLIKCARDEGTLSGEQLAAFETLLRERLIAVRRDSQEIIVPTGQLFIEALPGKYAVLEDFKLIHRQLDAEKVDAEVRAAYLETLRVASRVTTGDLADPNVDRLIHISGQTPTVEVDTD